jgi:hypothetical protein
MSHVPGHARTDPSMPDLAPAARRSLVHSYIDTLATLHSVDHVAVGLGNFGPPGNYFARQVSRWSRQYRETETEKLPEVHELIAWLEGAIPYQTRTTIVHGDYSFHNLRPPTGLGSSVLTGTEHDRRSARRLHVFHPPWFAPPVNAAGGAIRGARHSGVRRLRSLPRAHQCDGLPNESFYRAFHAFRSGAILQGIICRTDGTTRERAGCAVQARRRQNTAVWNTPDASKVRTITSAPTFPAFGRCCVSPLTAR